MEQVHLDTAGVSQAVQVGHDTEAGRREAVVALTNVKEEIEARWHGMAKTAFRALYQLLDEDQNKIRVDGLVVTEATDTAMRNTVATDEENADAYRALMGM